MIGSLLAVAAVLLTPPSVADLAPLDRQARDFSGAIGNTVEIRWQADRTTATVGDDLTATLVVRGALNPAELERPALGGLGDDWQLLDAQSLPRYLTGGAVAFDYRARARREGAAELPAVPYAYYCPGRPEGKHFLTAYADPLTLDILRGDMSPTETVGPPVAGVPPPASWRNRVPAWSWLLPVAAAIPAAAVLRRAVEVRRVRQARERHPAATEAQRRLAAAGDSPDPVAAIRSALLGYLAARHGLPAASRTPDDVESVLAVTPALRVVVAVLKGCDAARFSSVGDDAASLARDAAAAVSGCERVAA